MKNVEGKLMFKSMLIQVLFADENVDGVNSLTLIIQRL